MSNDFLLLFLTNETQGGVTTWKAFQTFFSAPYPLHINQSSCCWAPAIPNVTQRAAETTGLPARFGFAPKENQIICHLLPLHVCVRMPIRAQQSEVLGHLMATGGWTSWAHPHKTAGSHRTELGSCRLPAASSCQNASPTRRFLGQEREGWFTKQVETFHCTLTFFFCGERQIILMFTISFSCCYCAGLT